MALTGENTGVVIYTETHPTTCCAHKISYFNHITIHHECTAELAKIPKIKQANRTYEAMNEFDQQL